MLGKFLCAAGLIVCLMVSSASASNLLFILDASGSMWGKVDGTPKIATAKQALSTLIGDLPADAKVGLMVYGHRDKSSCTDVELMLPVGQATPANLPSLLGAIVPKGKTPIAYSLSQAPKAFIGLEGGNNNVVLISDGIETCQGDPCAAAAQLAASNINVRVHVVGFDISAEDRAQLQCIARLGKGKYFSADSTEGFVDAVSEAVKVAAEEPVAKPAPPPPAQEEGPYFLDEFNGNSLSSNWEVLNEDPEGYIVENGKLLIVGMNNGHLSKGNVPNIIRYTGALPKGDWVATIKYSFPYQTGREAPFLSLYENNDNYITATTNSWSYYEEIRGARLYLSAWKRSRGKDTSFNTVIWGGAGGKAFTVDEAPNPIYLRIIKHGHSYTPSYRLEGMKQTEWKDLEKFSVLRPKGNLAFGIFQAEDVKGETPMFVDWFRIDTLQ